MVVSVHVGVFAAARDGTRPPICILSLAILVPFGPCNLQHLLLQQTEASSRGTSQARTGSKSLPSDDFEIQERTFISSRPPIPIATPRGETKSEIRTMWRLLPCCCCTTPLASVGGGIQQRLDMSDGMPLVASEQLVFRG